MATICPRLFVKGGEMYKTVLRSERWCCALRSLSSSDWKTPAADLSAVGSSVRDPAVVRAVAMWKPYGLQMLPEL